MRLRLPSEAAGSWSDKSADHAARDDALGDEVPDQLELRLAVQLPRQPEHDLAPETGITGSPLASTAVHKASRSAIHSGAPAGNTISLCTTGLREKSHARPVAASASSAAGGVGGGGYRRARVPLAPARRKRGPDL